MQLTQKVSGILLAAVLLVAAVPQSVLAATGVIYITPVSSSLQIGDSETLSLRINPGTTVDGVQATVSYNPAYLQLNGVDTSASPFSAQLQKSAGGGTITLALGNLSGGVSSDALIATINFTALAGSGSSSLIISNANATSSGSYTNPTTANASLSFTSPSGAGPVSGGSGGGGGSAAPPAAHSAGSGGSKTTDNEVNSATDTAAPDAAAATPGTTGTPVHLKSKLGKIGYTSAVVSVTSNQGLNLYVLYGTNPGQLTDKTAVAGSATRADLTLGQNAALLPGTQYYYQVVGEDSTGVLTKLPVQQLITAGYTVRVTVLDEQNHLLAHQLVTLHSRAQTVTTDAHGVATFIGAAPGLHHLQYRSGGKTYSNAVYVQGNQPAQTTAVVLPFQIAGHAPVRLITAVLVSAGLVAAYSLGFETARNRWLRFHSKHLARKLVAVGRSWLF